MNPRFDDDLVKAWYSQFPAYTPGMADIVEQEILEQLEGSLG